MKSQRDKRDTPQSICYFFVAVIKTKTKAMYERKTLFGLMVPEEESVIVEGRTWWRRPAEEAERIYLQPHAESRKQTRSGGKTINCESPSPAIRLL